MEPKKITVIGLGGVGGYFGAKMARSAEGDPRYEITFAARGETYEAVKKNGLTLLSPNQDPLTVRPGRLIGDLDDVRDPDLVLICVKEYDLEEVCARIRDRIRETTVLLPLMNGADIYDRVRGTIPHGVLLPACVYVASHIKERGVIEQKGSAGRIIAGRDPRHLQADTGWVIELIGNSGTEISFKEDAREDIWTKFLFIASFGLVTARYNEPIGRVCEEPPLKDRATRIMEEIQAVAGKMQIPLPAGIIPQTFTQAEGFPYNSPTSLQRDVHSGKQQNELELFAGAIMNYGSSYGVDTSETGKIYREIKALL